MGWRCKEVKIYNVLTEAKLIREFYKEKCERKKGNLNKINM